MNVRTVVCGALGGTCPTVANLGAFYLANPMADMPSPGLMIGMALFAVLGAIVAIGFGTESSRAAIIAGIAAPAIVSSALDGATTAQGAQAAAQAAAAAVEERPGTPAPPQPPPPAPAAEPLAAPSDAAPGTTRGGIRLSGEALAQTVMPPAPQLFRGLNMITLQPVLRGSLPDYLRLDVVALLPGNVEVPLGAITSIEPMTVTLPAGTRAIRVGESQIEVMPGRRALDVVIDAAPTVRGDLLWALGAKRSLEVREVQISPGN